MATQTLSLREQNIAWYLIGQKHSQKGSERKLIVGVFGNIATGKSTFFQLLRKFCNKEKDERLILSEKGTYQLDKVINLKTAKILTTTPQDLEFIGNSKAANENLVLIEIPASIYSPIDKKKPNIDLAIHIGNLFKIFGNQHNSEGKTKGALSFLFLIEAKTTKTKVDAWKKTFRTVFDMLSLDTIEKSLMDSVNFLVTKATSEIDQRIAINRIQSLLKSLDVDSMDKDRKNKYIEIIQNIAKSQKLEIFYKTTDDEAKNEQNIHQIFQNLLVDKLLAPKDPQKEPTQVQIEKSPDQNQKQIWQKEKKMSLNAEQLKMIETEYNVLILQFLRTIDEVLLEQLFKRGGYKNLEGAKQKFNETIDKLTKKESLKEQFKELQAKDDILVSIDILSAKMDMYRQVSTKNIQVCDNVVGVAKLYLELLQVLDPSNEFQNKLTRLIQIFAKFGLFPTKIEEKSHLIDSYWMRVIEYSHFIETIEPIVENTHEIFDRFFITAFAGAWDDKCQQILRKTFLKDSFRQHQSKAYYRQLVEILDIFFPTESMAEENGTDQNEQIKQVEQLRLKVQLLSFDIDAKNIKEEFQKFWNFYQSIQKDFSSYDERTKCCIYQFFGKFLFSMRQYHLSAQIFQNCNNLYFAKQSYDCLLMNPFELPYEVALQYLTLLQKMNLSQRYIEVCYKIGDCFYERRNEMEEKITSELRREKGKNLRCWKEEGVEKVGEDVEGEIERILNMIQ